MAPLACHWRSTGVPLACPRLYSLDRWTRFARKLCLRRFLVLQWTCEPQRALKHRRQLESKSDSLIFTDRNFMKFIKKSREDRKTTTHIQTHSHCVAQLAQFANRNCQNSDSLTLDLESGSHLALPRSEVFQPIPKGWTWIDHIIRHHPTSSDIKSLAVLLRQAYWVGYWASLGWDSAT